MHRKKNLTERKFNIDIILIAFIISVIPLVVYLHMDKLDPVEAKYWTTGTANPDLFSFWKSTLFIIASSIIFCLFIRRNLTNRFIYKKSSIYIPSLLYILFIILSTVTSQYKNIALFGFVGRHEGMIVLIFYLLNMLFVYNTVNGENQIKILIVSLFASSSVIGLIGLSQLLGHNFLLTGIGKALIIPPQYANIKFNTVFGNMVFSTFSNPNYVGSYVVMLLPISLILYNIVKRRYLSVLVGAISLLLLVILFGSLSAAGLVGLVVNILLSLIIFREKILKNKFVKIIIPAISLSILIAGGIIAAAKLPGLKEQSYLKDIVFGSNDISIISSKETLKLVMNGSKITFYDGSGNLLEIDITESGNDSVVKFKKTEYNNYTIYSSGDTLRIARNDAEFALKLENDGFKFMGINGDELNKVEKPALIDVAGYEKLGSARVYIWSRTIPMLKNAIFKGYGPDLFTVYFPQNDYIGKINAYGKPGVIVDKPHNLYLQIAANTGIISLIAFLVLMGLYISSGIKLYIRKYSHSFVSLAGAAIFISVCSYLAVAFFNDSVVGVASVFWILLGLGFACNDLVRNEQKMK